jgi:hypothetical protein
MIISEQQVQLALADLHKAHPVVTSSVVGAEGVSPELIARVRAELARVPDMRADRVAEAREWLAADDTDSGAVAEKMIGRIISDAIR